jgi:hypothetical protein
MAEHTINENRKSKRFPTHLKAHYFFKERSGKGKECVVINISLNGAGLEFYTAKQLMSLLNFFYRSPPRGMEPLVLKE